MKRTTLAAMVLLLGSQGWAYAADGFEKVAVIFEQNATDQDVEVVFEAIAGGSALVALTVTAPGGRIVADFKAPDSKMGIAHVTLETPEPKNDGSMQAAFPEGEYLFNASTVNGSKISGKAMLTHKLPNTVAVIRPRPDQEGVPLKGLQIRWSGVKNMAAYSVMVELEGTDMNVSAHLPGTATSFNVPDGFLQPNAEYKVAIGAIAQDGNKSAVEASFKTGSK
jgi:hypothetical protein